MLSQVESVSEYKVRNWTALEWDVVLDDIVDKGGVQGYVESVTDSSCLEK